MKYNLRFNTKIKNLLFKEQVTSDNNEQSSLRQFENSSNIPSSSDDNFKANNTG